MATLYAMTIDTEEEWDWNGPYPVTGLSVKNVRNLPRFQDLFARHGVAATYFTDQAVFDDAEARGVLLDLAKRERVEIGLHIHPWNTPPLAHNGPVQPRETYLHNLPDDLIDAKLSSVYQRFVEHGLRPTSFRGGRFSSGGRIHAFLRDRGVLVDSSVVPYSRWEEDGAPDYRHRDLTPVRLPPRHEGDRPLWEVPVTLGFTRQPFAFWGRFYDRVAHSRLGRLRLIGAAERLGVVRKVWLNFEAPLGRHMLPFLKKLRGTALPCVVFMIHSSSLMAGGNPYAPTEADEDRIYAQIDEVFGALAGWPDFRPAMMTEMATQLEEQHHARTGH